MILKQILYFGEKCTLICDSKCNSAWGINSRPKVQLSEDIDDYEYLSDIELNTAPSDPGTYEGSNGKPLFQEKQLNIWCARECERSMIINDNENFILKDFNVRIKNIKK